MELRVYEGTNPALRPSQAEGGNLIGGVNTFTSSSAVLQVASPYGGIIDATLAGTAVTPTTDVREWVEARVAVTCFYE